LSEEVLEGLDEVLNQVFSVLFGGAVLGTLADGLVEQAAVLGGGGGSVDLGLIGVLSRALVVHVH